VAYFPAAVRIARLMGNGVRYRICRYTGSPDRLRSLSLEITHRCICRCCMCNIWRIPADVPDMNLTTIMELLRSPGLRTLRELDLTGGEPFLRQDIGSILQAVCNLQSTHFPELRTLAITTNGLLTERVLKQVGEIIGPLGEQGVDLVLACGIDAVGGLHDRIRQYPGAWDCLQQTLEGLYRIRDSHLNLILGIKTTVVPLNVRELDRITDFAEKNRLFTIISPRILTANRFRNNELEADLRFTDEDRKEMIRFFRSPRFAWAGHREALLRYLSGGPMRKPCSAGHNTLFVRHNGEVFPCPVISAPLGNISTHPLEMLYGNSTACEFRKRVGTFPECAACTEPGLERLAWPCEGFTCLGLAWRRGLEDFESLIRHMGIDKHL